MDVGGGWAGYILSTLLALGAALALAWLVIRLLPRLYGRGFAGRPRPADGVLEVAARLPLEPNRTLYLVKAPGTWLLLASGESGFERIAELEHDAVEQALTRAREEGAAAPTLGDVLRRLMKRSGSDRSTGGGSAS